jgi:hypothetical protein
MHSTVAEKKPEEQNRSPVGPSPAHDGGDGAVHADGPDTLLFDARAILGLQAFAGNAAVASLMAERQAPETNEASPAGPGENEEELASLEGKADASSPAESLDDSPAQVAQDAQAEIESLSSSGTETAVGEGGGAAGGGAIEERAPPQVPQLDKSDPARALAGAGSLPPAQLLTALGGVGAAASGAGTRERAQLVTSPPQRPHNAGQVVRRPRPAVAQAAESPSVSEAPPAESADADHLRVRRTELDSRIQGEHQTHLREAAHPLGEDEIHPNLPSQILRANVSPNGGERSSPEVGETDHAVSLIAQQEKGAEIQAAVGQGLAQMAAAKQLHLARTADEKARTAQEMQQLEETHAAEQGAERSAARAEVVAMRGRWTDEQRAVATTSRLESDHTVSSAVEKIAHQKSEARQLADAHQQQGEREAEAAKRQGEHEAAAEREKATGQSQGGFLGWAASAAQSLVDHAKQAVQFVLGKARALVSAAIDRAKQLAAAVMERARQAIAGVVRAGADTLQAIGARAFSAFRAVSDRFRQAIEERIAIAKAAVDKLAGFLKQNIERALNGLAAVMVASVGLLESGLHAAVDGVRTVVQGAIQFARSAIDALGTFAELVKDVAANPVQWVSNLAASAMDGVRNHLWPALKESIQGWFNDKVDAVLGLGAAVWSLLRRGGITVAQVARVAWEGIKSAIPPTVISVLIEKVVSLLVPAAAAALLIVQAIQAAWASLGRILQAVDAFVKFLKGVRWGDAGHLFGQALGLGAVAVIDFLSNFLLQRLMSSAGKVAAPIRALAKRIGLRLSGAARGIGAGAGKAGGWVKGAAGRAKAWTGLEAAEVSAGFRRAGRSFRQSKVGSAVMTPYDAWRGARVGKQLAARGGTAPVHMTIREFAKNEAAQRQLFEAAQKVRAAQEEFAKGLLADLKIQGEAGSILKRPDFDGFRKGILNKAARKGYTNVGDMDDMVRGRFNLSTPRDVQTVAEALETQTKYAVISSTGPRLEAGVAGGYPRYHAILLDAETGMTHEWQVGTTAVTRLYETEGITIPRALKPLPKHMHADLHDIQYDLFNSIERDYPQVASRYGLRDFRAKVANLAAEGGERGDQLLKAGKGGPMSMSPFAERMRALHEEAGAILNRLVDEKGPNFIRRFYH